MKKITLLTIVCWTAQLIAGMDPPPAKAKTWVINVTDYRVAQPSPADLQGDVAALKQLVSQRDAAQMSRIVFWDAGPPAYRWIQIASDEVNAHNLGGPFATRAMALVAAAINDATAAAWDSKYLYMRQRPQEVDPTIVAAVRVPRTPSYPSDYAAVAGAAASVLSYLFPERGNVLDAMAREAAESRLKAGVEFPSDGVAGMAMGRRVGAAVVAYGRSDGSDAMFSGSFPPTPGVWSNPSPAAPLAGTWKTWAGEPASAIRLAAPPAADSPEMTARVDELRQLVRNTNITRTAWVWQASFTTPWLDTLAQKMLEYHLDRDPPAAARAYAETMLAQHDATIACWDTKYAYLEMRPIMFDSTITTLFATPAHPSFPSGHACASGAIAFVLGTLFPSDTASFDAKASEGGLSTFYAGIHFRADVEAGLELGRTAAKRIVEKAAQ